MDIRAIAYHEAGHAVIGYICEQPFAYVTIEPKEAEMGHIESGEGEHKKVVIEEGYGGRVEFTNTETIDSILAESESDLWLKDHPTAVAIVKGAILSAMAGSISQENGMRGSVESWQAEQDWKDAGSMLGSIYKENCSEESEKARKEVETILEKNWNLVEHVVEALLEKRTISYDDVFAICKMQQEVSSSDQGPRGAGVRGDPEKIARRGKEQADRAATGEAGRWRSPPPLT
jgi:ATP-dependent Zn protease